MPMFEYRCTRCGHEFEELVFGDENPVCPACRAEATEKLISKPCLPLRRRKPRRFRRALRAVFPEADARLFRRQLRELH